MKTLDEVECSPTGEPVLKPVEPHIKNGLMKSQLDGDQRGSSRPRSVKALNRFIKAARLVIAVLPVFLSFGVVASPAHKPVLVIQGEVQATEVNVVPMVMGRVQALHVREGDRVRKGQLLVSLENPELQARLEQARAAMELAKEHNKILQAACVEYICAQSNLWRQAKAAAEHAEQTADRSRAFHAAKVISLQELQDLERDLEGARSSERAARASSDLARALFGNEGQLAAAASLQQATQRVAELDALVAELTLTSPIDGEVQSQIVEHGELANPGMPVMTIVDPQDLWVRFNVPEDALSKIRMGTTLRARVPALGNQEVPVKVNYISPNRHFVSSRAANGTGDFDARTFEVRAVPSQVAEGLRPGMSALLTWQK